MLEFSFIDLRGNIILCFMISNFSLKETRVCVDVNVNKIRATCGARKTDQLATHQPDMVLQHVCIILAFFYIHLVQNRLFKVTIAQFFKFLSLF
jgi:hypothetical protein